MGGDPDTFWRQTPKTFAIFVHGKTRAKEDAVTGLQYQAWLIASLSGFREVPPYEEVFKVKPKRQSPEEMAAVARHIASTGWGIYAPPPETPDIGE